MRQYQQQALMGASSEQLVAKLYDLGVAACHGGDRAKARAVLVQLLAGLDYERGGEIAERLQALYTFCLGQATDGGDLADVAYILDGLRTAWAEGVLNTRQAA
jgi:flagellar protein FliS